MELTSFILLFIVGTVAGFINVMAGGGSSIVLPFLIFLGLDASLANGTNRIAIFIQNVSAILSFKKEQVSDFKISFKIGLFALPGAVTGAIIATKISDELFETILAIIMIGIVISMILPKSKKHYSKDLVNKIPILIYPIMFLIGFYGGFIQVGVGFLLMAALHYILHLNLVKVNMHKVFIVFLYTIPALSIFIFTGNVDWIIGIVLACGNAFGAWWAAKLAVKKGDKVIRVILSVVVLGMSLKLLGVF